MNVGFYYHAGTVVDDAHVAVPSHLAVFLEELGRQAGSLTFYGHSGPRSAIEDRTLSAPLVRPVDLGPRRSFPARTFWPRPALRRFKRRHDHIDILLIRGPTPLLPHLVRAAFCPVALLLVGDYRGLTPDAAQWWRGLAISGWVRVYSRQQARAGRRTLVLTNSRPLTQAADPSWPWVREIFTSSLSEHDLETLHEGRPWAAGTGTALPVRLLFAGRIAEEKGLVEAVEALALLQARGWNAILELLGWSEDTGFTEFLEDLARRRGVAGRLIFGGYRRAGPELLRAYRDADIFIMPSHAEGFPRAIVEALAAGCPVVASRVGGIPGRLSERTAILIKPKAPNELADAVEKLITDAELRETLVHQGRRWATSFTNERSCALVAEALRDWVEFRATIPQVRGADAVGEV